MDTIAIEQWKKLNKQLTTFSREDEAKLDQLQMGITKHKKKQRISFSREQGWVPAEIQLLCSVTGRRPTISNSIKRERLATADR